MAAKLMLIYHKSSNMRVELITTHIDTDSWIKQNLRVCLILSTCDQQVCNVLERNEIYVLLSATFQTCAYAYIIP